MLNGIIALAIIGLLALALVRIPWRSNFMVFQLPEKKPVPTIHMPEGVQSAPMPNIIPTPTPFDLRDPVLTFPAGRNPITPTPAQQKPL